MTDDAFDDLVPLGEEGLPDLPEDAVALDRLRACVGLPLNDLGNAQRFVVHFGDDAAFVGQVGWHIWDGVRWLGDPEISREVSPAVRAVAQKLGPLVAQEAGLIAPGAADAALLAREVRLKADLAALNRRDPADRSPSHDAEVAEIAGRIKGVEAQLKGHRARISRHLTHAKNAGNSGAMTNLLREASVLQHRDVTTMDADPLLVNTLTGALRFSVERADGMSAVARVDLLPHARDQWLTKVMPVEWRPGAEAPKFKAFLARVQPDAEMRGFLQRWFGLSMTGLTGEQKLVFLHGQGANGKSVLVDLMARIMGDYAASARIESLIGKNKRNAAEATPDLVPLIGARFVRASEPEEGERLQEGKIKELTGGEPILIRALNQGFVTYTPQFKLTISGNHKPDIRDTSDGIWRRLLLVPWEVQIPASERNPNLVNELFAEGPGILQWLADGLVDYLEGGLQVPDRVSDATSAYRADSDPVAAFLDTCCVVTGVDADFIRGRELAGAYAFWQHSNMMTPWGLNVVGKRLAEKAANWRSRSGMQFRRGKASETMFYGIKLTDTFRRQYQDAPRDQRGNLILGVGTVSGSGDSMAGGME